MRKLLLNSKFIVFTLSLALTSSVGAQSCCDWNGQKSIASVSPFYWPSDAQLADLMSSGLRSDFTIDASGEKVAFIGDLQINGAAPGTSKTCSSSGCSVSWLPGATVTWSTVNSTTAFDVGIDTVSTTTGPPTVPEDETLNVKGTCTQVASACSIAASTYKTISMSSGSLSMSSGTKYAIVFDMTAKDADADTMNFAHLGVNLAGQAIGQPAAVTKTGGTWAAIALQFFPNVTITFDDGTIGWLNGSMVAAAVAGTNFNSGSSPNERALIFTAPCNCTIAEVGAMIGPASGSATLDVVIYGDPLNTYPTLSTTTIDPNQILATNIDVIRAMPSTRVPVIKGKVYAVSVKPTSANNVNLSALTVGAEGDMNANPGGASAYLGTRNATNVAFSATTTQRPLIWVRFSHLSP